MITTVTPLAIAQVKYKKVMIDPRQKNSFSFTQQWDYRWDVFKDDSTGKFCRNDDQPLTADDTAHLYYTANCVTNVQGGYDIRYCSATKLNDTILMVFSDGRPAYASEFRVYIMGDLFYFQPHTIYPSSVNREAISYRVTQQALVINKANYAVGEVLQGRIGAEFIETVQRPDQPPRKQKLFLKGYFSTAIGSMK